MAATASSLSAVPLTKRKNACARKRLPAQIGFVIHQLCYTVSAMDLMADVFMKSGNLDVDNHKPRNKRNKKL